MSTYGDLSSWDIAFGLSELVDYSQDTGLGDLVPNMDALNSWWGDTRALTELGATLGRPASNPTNGSESSGGAENVGHFASILGGSFDELGGYFFGTREAPGAAGYSGLGRASFGILGHVFSFVDLVIDVRAAPTNSHAVLGVGYGTVIGIGGAMLGGLVMGPFGAVWAGGLAPS